MFEVAFYPYSFKEKVVVKRFLVQAEARQAAAAFLKSHRRCGFFVVVVKSCEK